ncbi:hypothetical protein TNCV_2493101 [Trichonephila clavipes]|uniref:Uncharacterized protein n=1 Tax=Trichonephila clavipes TaxID=2585209 RepID=A0A8X6RUJ2_TRICX|nr:hypothetical protein TNCV_2493101 [Trichonephila clavipes]
MPREDTIQLQTTMSSPGFEPRPYGTAVSVANQCTGWAIRTLLNLTSGVTENIRASMQSQVLGPKPYLTKDFILGVNQTLSPLETWASS